MKDRVIRKTLSERQRKIENAKRIAAETAKKAFAIPEISKANEAYTTAVFDDMVKGVENSKTTQKARLSYQNALKKYGFDENDFQYKPVCPICEDTGKADGKVCKCAFDDYVKNLKIECELDKRAPFSFADCNLDGVRDEQEKQNLAKLYSSMQKYVEKFPNVKSINLLFTGGVGTGKTCLASAIATGVVEKGYCAKIMSAYEFNSLMLTVHTSPIAERNALMDDVLTSDLLVIDDLGTEPMLKRVTIEYLLLVIEERQAKGLATIITTNLDVERLLARYGERIYSRLSHKQHSMIIQFVGKDLRLGN